MRIAEITVQGVEATALIQSKITAGMVGATVKILYPDPYWSGLVKNVVFRGAGEKTVLNTGETVEIPAKVIAKANVRLMIGIVGVSAAGNTQVTPTIWAELGVVNAAPYVSQQISGGGKPPVLGPPPSQDAPLWAQVEAMIGDLNALGTNDRANVVAAINELVRQTGNVETLITNDKASIVSAINWIVREGIGTPEIGSNGNWIIGGKDTGLPSRGPKGDQGASGVYVGSGEMPDGYNVQIDPDGEPLDLVIDPEDIKNAVDEYLEENPPAQGAPGKDGKTPVKGEDYFTPADIQEIAEQAAALVEVPSGGGGGSIELIADIVLEEETDSITITADTEGKPFVLHGYYIYVRCPAAPSQNGIGYLRVYAYDAANKSITPLCAGGPATTTPYFEAIAQIELSDKYNPLLKTFMSRTNKYTNFTVPYQYGEWPITQNLTGPIVKLSFHSGAFYPAGTIIKIFKTR